MRRVLAFELHDEAAALRQEHGWRDNGHSAKTLVKHHGQRIVLMVMKEGARMRKHSASGAISVQVLSGHLKINVGKATFAVPAGGLLALDPGLRHDVEATEDSSFVLSVSLTPAKRRLLGSRSP